LSALSEISAPWCSDGLIQIPNLLQSSVYQFQLDDGRWYDQTIGSATSQELDQILGHMEDDMADTYDPAVFLDRLNAPQEMGSDGAIVREHKLPEVIRPINTCSPSPPGQGRQGLSFQADDPGG